MIDSYEIMLISIFNDAVESHRYTEYKLKDVNQRCIDLLNNYEIKDGEKIKLSVRDKIRENVIFNAEIHDLNALKLSNEFIDLKRSIINAVNGYEFNKVKSFYPIQLIF